MKGLGRRKCHQTARTIRHAETTTSAACTGLKRASTPNEPKVITPPSTANALNTMATRIRVGRPPRCALKYAFPLQVEAAFSLLTSKPIKMPISQTAAVAISAWSRERLGVCRDRPRYTATVWRVARGLHGAVTAGGYVHIAIHDHRAAPASAAVYAISMPLAVTATLACAAAAAVAGAR